jgi:hypothetical protein
VFGSRLTSVAWASGYHFGSHMAGQPIVINGVTYTVSTYNSATSLTLTTSAGTQTGVAYYDLPVLSQVADGGDVENADGYDIIFTSDAGCTTILPFEKDVYSSIGAIAFWVKIASVTTASDATFYMCYDNSSISTFQGGAASAVWSNGYIAVYHGGDGTTLDVNDSLGSFNGTNNSATATAGQIGGAIAFSGSSQYVDLGTSTGLNPSPMGRGVLDELGSSTSGLMSGDGKRGVASPSAPALVLDSTRRRLLRTGRLGESNRPRRPGKSRAMLIIRCDLHTRCQQIAVLDKETGEVVEHRLEHENGESGRSMPASLRGCRRDWSNHPPAHWFERMLTEFHHELWVGDAAPDSRHERAPAKARSARRLAPDGLDGLGSLSPYLDSFAAGNATCGSCWRIATSWCGCGWP